MTAPPHASATGGSLLLNIQHWALLRLQFASKRLRPNAKLRPHLQVGLRGEFEALFYLRRLGFSIVERRWRSPELRGDLDLIAWEGETLAIVEVKTRSARDFTPAAMAVDRSKRTMLREMSASYVRTLPQEYRKDILVRFDIVSVYLLPTGVECEILRDIDVSDPRPAGRW